MKTNPSRTDALVHAQHRSRQGVLPLTLAAVGLGVTLALLWLWHPSLRPVEDWGWLPKAWIAGIALVLLTALVAWWLRRQGLLRSAAELDAELAAGNRLETATALRAAADPLAQAQRAETESFLQHTRVARRNWRLPLLGTLGLFLLLGHAATFLCWSRPLKSVADPAADALSEVASARAEILWESPETEITAAAIEEVPLAAVADSTGGLRDAALEIEINGAARLTQSLAVTNLNLPGKHPITTSIYLDQLAAQTYDIVSYHLRAQRIDRRKLPPTLSAAQFIQVKPLREDVFVCAGGDKPSKCFNYVVALKAAQLRLLKENFALAHAEISREREEWRQENTRVGDEQGELEGRTGEVIQLLTTNHYPPEILTLVEQAQPLMKDAAHKIQTRENQPALPPQGKALGLLTEVERYLKHTINLSKAGGQPKAPDPFERDKKLELKNRPKTKSARVESLANEQARLAGDLAGMKTNANVTVPEPDAKDPDRISGSPGERQKEIRRRVGEFLEDDAIEPAALDHLQKGHDLAGVSQGWLDQADIAAAREPSAEAARELRQTVVAMRQSADDAAKNELADALRQLAGAAGKMRGTSLLSSEADAKAQAASVTASVQETARRLAAAARAQQEQGSGKAAAQLMEFAKSLESDSLKQSLARAGENPRDPASTQDAANQLSRLAGRAAELRQPEALSKTELARLVNRLERTAANVQRLASGSCSSGQAGGGSKGGAGGKGESLEQQLAANVAGELREATLGAPGGKGSGKSLAQLRELVASGNPGAPGEGTSDCVVFAQKIEPPLKELIEVLRAELANFQRQHVLVDQDIAMALPAYRPAVAEYFEQLSRDYGTNSVGQQAAKK